MSDVFNPIREAISGLWRRSSISRDDVEALLTDLGLGRLSDADPHQYPRIWRWIDLKESGDLV